MILSSETVEKKVPPPKTPRVYKPVTEKVWSAKQMEDHTKKIVAKAVSDALEVQKAVQKAADLAVEKACLKKVKTDPANSLMLSDAGFLQTYVPASRGRGGAGRGGRGGSGGMRSTLAFPGPIDEFPIDVTSDRALAALEASTNHAMASIEFGACVMAKSLHVQNYMDKVRGITAPRPGAAATGGNESGTELNKLAVLEAQVLRMQEAASHNQEMLEMKLKLQAAEAVSKGLEAAEQKRLDKEKKREKKERASQQQLSQQQQFQNFLVLQQFEYNFKLNLHDFYTYM